MKSFPFWVCYDGAESGDRTVRIHTATCQWCNDGLGIKPKDRDPGIRWIPFNSFERAATYAVETLAEAPTPCAHCRPDSE
ncbi:MAG: hypothetical protein ACAH95_06080 [Fimbriimonas sp.]